MRFASRTRRYLARTIVVVALAILLLLALTWRPEVAPVEPPAARGFDPSLIRQGAELAALGDCSTCHTVRGGTTFAGGRAILTPFGTIYSTNITPDPSTGIGRWSQGAFARAMREGVDRQGRHLYPVFPYDHFTLLTDADIDALYAFFMTRLPVRAQAPRNEVSFPLSFRPLLAAWKLLFFRPRRYRQDDRHDAAWNRGGILGGRHRTLRRLPHSAQCIWSRGCKPTLRRRERRGLACLLAQFDVASARRLGCRVDGFLSAQRVACFARCRARPDGGRN
jgi:mono/diheme cytochrome c family protein